MVRACLATPQASKHHLGLSPPACFTAPGTPFLFSHCYPSPAPSLQGTDRIPLPGSSQTLPLTSSAPSSLTLRSALPHDGKEHPTLDVGGILPTCGAYHPVHSAPKARLQVCFSRSPLALPVEASQGQGGTFLEPAPSHRGLLHASLTSYGPYLHLAHQGPSVPHPCAFVTGLCGTGSERSS